MGFFIAEARKKYWDFLLWPMTSIKELVDRRPWDKQIRMAGIWFSPKLGNKGTVTSYKVVS